MSSNDLFSKQDLVYLHVKSNLQKLDLIVNGIISKSYCISTAKKGFGEQKNSEKTPRGWHVIRAKIGDFSPLGTVFVARRPTGEIYSEKLAKEHSNRDWILTRILWLSGLEIGKNRLGMVDTMQRYIYIHGAHSSTNFDKPRSKGCVNMKCEDIIELFSLVDVGTKVFIGNEIYPL